MSDAQEFVSFKVAFEPFEKLEDGQPVKLVPQGTFYRGNRKLEITAELLKQVAANFAKGLPRFRVPINLDHDQNGGKVGNIRNIKYLDSGPKGAGLYVTEYELTEKGKEAIEQSGYDGVSAELVWDLGGGQYQDPETGKMHKNVLVGMALTPKPFFGHKHVALFSVYPGELVDMAYGGAKSFEEYERHLGEQTERERVAALNDVYRSLFNNIWDDPIMGIEAKSEAVSSLTSEFRLKILKGDDYEAEEPEVEEFAADDEEPADDIQEESMADEKAPEAVETEQLTAELSEAKEELAAKTARLAELEERFAAEEKAKKEAKLRGDAEAFEALPVVIDEYVEKMDAFDEETYGWLHAQFVTFDEAMKKAGILEESGSDREDGGTDAEKFVAAIEASIEQDFDGDRSKYAEALMKVSLAHPELARAYDASVVEE